ncbi:SDR family NAD(P)-dependent oxidoreductase [Sandaracinobacteroides saxicola]|uniref:SDR family oxidoreductase n=1 Tax=Sandaracinobacteroides saxicola TaxID=2759707 RepID=A0A7G5IEY4_9SPHN|nr:SDR family NAD(P)-dependent oxidoreductase [Sandaracinobacteroides saxicola]QMW21926.1 SDR family oxidoreductase [Sandaracinobacteroides saxicola]
MKRALVTGAASGIGAGIAARLRADGFTVLTVDRAAGCDLTLDVSAPGSAETMVEACRDRLGGLDVLVANAGVSAFEMIDGHDEAVWSDTIAINLDSVFRLVRNAVSLMKQGEAAAKGAARIITIGSVMSSHGEAGMAAYAAAKHGVLGLTRALAVELGPAGITVNCIQPGAILTGITKPAFAANPAFGDYWVQKSALKRLGTPEDIAGVAAFLAGEDSRFMTGAALVVDAGATAHP